MEIEADRARSEMKNFPDPSGGQTLLETILVLPLLLILLGGGHWFYLELSLSSSSGSAAHAEMLRAGRRQVGIEHLLSAGIHPGSDVARIQAHNSPLVGRVPPFGGVAGRTIASADIKLENDAVGAFLDLPSHTFRRVAEGAVDCWGVGTPTGAKVRTTVRGILLTGAMR